MTFGPQGPKVSRFSVESNVIRSLFTLRPYVHLTRRPGKPR
jgi:hypothetical protein